MDPGGDELRLQIAIRYRQADHAALSQALVIRPRVCHLIPGLPALTQFARFIPALYGIIQAGFIMLRFYTTRSVFAIPPIRTKPKLSWIGVKAPGMIAVMAPVGSGVKRG